ncbi:MAG: ATP-binding protein [Planctomycetota bacterium]|nr:MAG: ATP-binding protein [Planctomycetota bacterium]
MSTIDHPHALYLGREYDLAAGELLPAPLLYETDDLTTHAVCVGMTGSGKTGLCLALLEEAALRGVPAIAIDPKGDLGNLLLAFPELQPRDFLPWIDQAAARREGRTPDEEAAQTAQRWRQGLTQWDQDGQRIRRFTEAVDRAIYTPGSSSGLPLSVLKSFAAPAPAVLGDDDALRDRIDGAATGLLGLLGVEADPANSREHILLARILEEAWRAGRDLDLETIIHAIQRPPLERVGVVDLESFFPAAERLALGMRINNLLASPALAAWLEGEPLDVQRLLYTDAGQPRLSILSIAHLDDAQRMFFVTLLLGEVVAWMRSQPGSSSLRALLYMDEVFGYFPPSANPPSKRPMLTLMKQARAFGLGCVLATQNPVDLDYKGLSNAGTWFLGRLQTERDKLRVIEGLEGASVEAGASFNRRQMEATLAALDKRVFLLNNVHAPTPKIFQTRWAMSYLAGPLTRTQIGQLMAARKSLRSETGPPPGDAPRPETARRPVVSAEINQCFVKPDLEMQPSAGEQLAYRPALFATGKLHYVSAADEVDHWQPFAALQPAHGNVSRPAWATALIFPQPPALADGPAAAAGFAELPPELAQAKNYRRWDDDLIDHLYQTERLSLLRSKDFKACSAPGESEEAFRQRLAALATGELAARRAEIRARYASRIEKQLERVAAAEAKAAQEKAQFWTRVGGMVGRAAEASLSVLFGRKSRKRLVTSTSAGAAVRQRQQQSQAERRLAEESAKLQALREAEQDELAQLDGAQRAETLALEKFSLAPRKSDIAVDQVALAWVPWLVAADGAVRPAY